MCVWGGGDLAYQKMVFDFLELGLLAVVSILARVLGAEPGPLEVQQVLLTPSPYKETKVQRG